MLEDSPYSLYQGITSPRHDDLVVQDLFSAFRTLPDELYQERSEESDLRLLHLGTSMPEEEGCNYTLVRSCP
jgi:hypothetical protein